MRKFDSGFTPAFTPMEMIQMGVFGGAYFTEKERAEFPARWFKGVALYATPLAEANHFGVLSGLSRESWIQRRWIMNRDPLGHFQWYCRYYCGRRCEDDARQIARWRAFKRHSAQVERHGNGDVTRRIVQRQALLQWSYEPLPDKLGGIREYNLKHKH